MKINGVESQVQNVEKPKKVEVKEKGSVRAIAGSAVLSEAITLPTGIVSVASMQKIANSLSPDQKKVINEVADNLIQKTKLAEKGVKICHLPSYGESSWIGERLNAILAIENGKNAAFANKDVKSIIGTVVYPKNSILVNRDKLPTALFHEIGHAYNFHNSKILKGIQNARNPLILVSLALAIFSAFSKKEEAGEGKELTGAQKTKNFVRKHSGIMATMAMIPIVAEEAVASLRAAKWVKTSLPKDLAKKVNRSNICGALAYAATAIGMGVAAHFATKIKDSIMEKQKAKALQEAENAEKNETIEKKQGNVGGGGTSRRSEGTGRDRALQEAENAEETKIVEFEQKNVGGGDTTCRGGGAGRGR